MKTSPINFTGITRVDIKQTELNAGQYNGHGEPGEIVIDLTTYDAFIANADGFLNDFSNPTGLIAFNISNGTSNVKVYGANGNIGFTVGGSSNVAEFGSGTSLFRGNLIPALNSTYSLGNATRQIDGVWLSGFTAYIDNIAIANTGGQLTVDGDPVLVQTVDGNLNISNVTANTVTVGIDLTVSQDASMTGDIDITGEMAIGGNITTSEDVVADNFITSGEVSAFQDITGANITGLEVNAVNMNVGGDVLIVGNLTATDGLITDTVRSPSGNLTLQGSGASGNIIFDPTGTGFISVSGALISNVGTPVDNHDMSTKQYADETIVGQVPKDSVQAGTIDDLAVMSGGAVTYNNGVAGVGATLTLSVGLTNIDGVVLVPGFRILVKDQVNEAENGIYVYNGPTLYTRATDADTPTELTGGTFIFVKSGVQNRSSGHSIIQGPVVVGTDPVKFVQLSGELNYGGHNGLFLTGNEFNIIPVMPAGTYGNSTANSLAMTVNDYGKFTSLTNAVIGPVANLVIDTNLFAGNLSATTNINILGNATTTGNTTAAAVNITTNTRLNNVVVTRNLSVNGFSFNNAMVVKNTLLGRDVRTIYSAANVRNLTITSVNSNFYDANIFGNVTTVGSRRVDFGLVSKLRITGGNNGDALVTTATGFAAWGAGDNLNIGNLQVNELNLAGTLNTSVSLNNNTRPFNWQAGYPSSSIYPYPNILAGDVISEYDGISPGLELRVGRSTFSSSRTFTRADLLTRDKPLISSVSLVSRLRPGVTNNITNTDRPAGIFFGFADSITRDNELVASSNQKFYSNVLSNVYPAAMSITNTNYFGGNPETSGSLYPYALRLYGPNPDIGQNDGQFYNRNIFRIDAFDSSLLNLAIVYVFPSSSAYRWLYYYINNTLVGSIYWTPNSPEDSWIQNWDNNTPYLYQFSTISVETPGVNYSSFVLKRWYVGSAQSFMYKNLATPIARMPA